MKKENIWKRVLLLALLVFVIVNIVWYINYRMYDGYIREGYQKFRTSYNKSDRHYDLTVKKPYYMSFVGNLAIVNKSQTLTIIIWPRALAGQPFEYGVVIYDDVNKCQYMIYVDEQFAYLEDKNKNVTATERMKEKKILRTNRDELKGLYTIAKEEWNL